MKKRESISIHQVCFYAYSPTEKKEFRRDLWLLDFDGRRDFIGDRNFAGIAVRIDFTNERIAFEPPRGVRHKISLTIVDTTTRTEIAQESTVILITRDNYFKFHYVDFPLVPTQFHAGHNYKLIVQDLTEGATMGEYPFHLFSVTQLGDPKKWYVVSNGGVRPSWQSDLYRSLLVRSYYEYNVRFNVEHRFGIKPPMIFPELEMRLYYPKKNRVEVRLLEPIMRGFDRNSYFVEQEFVVPEIQQGTFYAELRCMSIPIAGFVFNTCTREDRGSWCGPEITPIYEYSLEAAGERLRKFSLPDTEWTDEQKEETIDFEDVLNRFIESEKSGGAY